MLIWSVRASIGGYASGRYSGNELRYRMQRRILQARNWVEDANGLFQYALEFEVSPMWLVLPTKLWHKKHQDLQRLAFDFFGHQFECFTVFLSYFTVFLSYR